MFIKIFLKDVVLKGNSLLLSVGIHSMSHAWLKSLMGGAVRAWCLIRSQTQKSRLKKKRNVTSNFYLRKPFLF